MGTVAAIDAGYGMVKAISATRTGNGKIRTRRAIFPATAMSVPSPQSGKIRMAGASVEVPNIVSFDVGNGMESYRVGEQNSPHFLTPDTRTLFPPPVLAMLIYALHAVGARDSALVVIGVPIGYKMSGGEIPGPRWPRGYIMDKPYTLSIRSTIVTGQTVGTIVAHQITSGVVVDVGYGTTDIVIVVGGKIRKAVSVEVGVSDAVPLSGYGTTDPQSVVKADSRFIAGVCEKISERLALEMRQLGTSLPVYLTGGGGEIVARTGAINAQLVRGALWSNAEGLLRVAKAIAVKRKLVSW